MQFGFHNRVGFLLFIIFVFLSCCNIETNNVNNIVWSVEKIAKGDYLTLKNSLNKLPQKGDIVNKDLELLLAENAIFFPEIEYENENTEALHQLNISLENSIAIKIKPLLTDSLKSFLVQNYPNVLYRLELLLESKTLSEVASFLLNVDRSQLSLIEYYNYMNLVFTFALCTKKQGYNGLSLSSIDFGLHLCETVPFDIQFPILKSQMLLLKFNEGAGMKRSNKFLNDLYDVLEEDICLQNSLDKLLVLSQIRGVYNIDYRIEASVQEIQGLDLNITDKVFLITDMGYTKLQEDPDLAIEYFKAILIIYDVDCSWFRNYVLVLIGLANEFKNDFVAANKYFEMANDVTNCDDYNENHIVFSNIMLKMGYSNLFKSRLNNKQKFELYQKQRKAAVATFLSESDHYDDFFAQNVKNSLEVFNGEEIVEEKIQLMILNLMENSSNRVLSRNKLKDTKNDSKENHVEIKQLQKKFNNFSDIKNFKDPDRQTLFMLMLQNFINEENDPIVQLPNSIDSSHLSKIKSSSKLVQYVRFHNNIFACFIQNHKFEVLKVDSELLDSLSLSFQKNIHDMNVLNDEISKIKELLFPFKLRGTDSLSVISFGNASDLPIHLLFTNPVKQFLNLNQFINENKVYLDKNDLMFYSFSDKKTIVSNEIKKIPELKYGFLECSQIVQNLGIELEIKSGNKMTRNNFFNFLNSDILHISTHAYSNKENRLDNYLILRKDDYSLDTLYTYEIEERNTAPKLAVLSACESGLGKHVNGKGTYDIGRAFINNGSQAVIKSLWKVNDKSTQVFMTELYKQWLTDISLFEALQNTRSYMRSTEFYHPYYWAGFILEGNGQLYLN